MSVNTMDFNQVSQVLADISSQVTGNAVQAPIDTTSWVSLAQTTLRAGYEPVLNAISQVIGKTIFSMRPYNRKFAGLQVDNQKYGAITRKLVVSDKPFENDAQFSLVDGQSVDHFVVNKPKVLETRFYGQNQYMKEITIFQDQLNSAFKGPEQFGEFMAMVTQNAQDMIEQAHESLARMTIAALAGGVKASVTAGTRGAESVVHLLTEYNQDTGQSLTATTIFAPANFKPFIQWYYAKVNELTQMMTERTSLYENHVTGYEINRHTPLADQLVYLYAPIRYQAEARAIADVYHDTYLQMADTETVNFWQTATSPDSVQVTPSYLDANGEVVDSQSAITIAPLFGVIADRDALGYTVMNEVTATTGLNAKGLYYNVFFHFLDRYWVDLMEKAIIMVLD